ncbi:hypothetical protein Micbo1qcDRAFT_166522 [Microdochium bolleyi]|uniref:C2H2-type domain-containing protein n=1 Tax=Microdochium bolleyi TaxID=196109 RepID=A0A136IUJ8_9PEZI|nr:hypothetical protein Micbo1qcDRAFT_166522 [Microdochium bolleyi]
MWIGQTQADGPCPILFRYAGSSASDGPDQGSKLGEAMAVLTESPVLARLGVNLTQIMYGRTMSVMRAEDPDLALSTEGAEPEVRDILTAQQLLTARRVRNKLGTSFEAIINVCLNQRYRESKLARVVKLDQNDPSFAEHATSMVLLPLYQELCKAFGCFCAPLSSHDGVTQGTPYQTQGAIAENSTGKPHAPVEAGSWQLLGRQSREPSQDELVEEKTPTASHHNEIPLSSPRHLAGQAVAATKSATAQDVDKEMEAPPQSREQTGLFLAKSRGVAAKQWQPAGEVRGQKSPEPRDAPKPTISALSDPHISPGLVGSNGPGFDFAQEQGSGHSYDSDSETTGSWFDWLSDNTEASPTIADDHPLSALTPIAVGILIRQYQMWRACAIEQQQQSSATPSRVPRSSNPRKRPKPSSNGQGDRQDDDEDNDDEGDDGPPDPGSSSKRRPEKEDIVTFSCPFLKKDSTKWGDCSKYRLRRIRDVKQHLARKHQMPMYCPLCMVTFPDEDHRDAHIISASCAPSQKSKPEGITEGQKRALSRKAPATQSPEDQWFGMWDILFPGHPRPASAYIDSALLRNAFVYQAFLANNGPSILTSVLETSGAVSWNPPSGTRDIQAWREQVISRAFQQLFDRWAASGAVAVPSREESTTGAGTSSMAIDSGIASSSSLAYTTQSPVVDMDGNITVGMGERMYRFDVPSSETASSVSGFLSWEADSESDLLSTSAANDMTSPSNPYSTMVTAQYNASSNLRFNPFEVQEMQHVWHQSMNLYGGVDANSTTNNHNNNISGGNNSLHGHGNDGGVNYHHQQNTRHGQ